MARWCVARNCSHGSSGKLKARYAAAALREDMCAKKVSGGAKSVASGSSVEDIVEDRLDAIRPYLHKMERGDENPSPGDTARRNVALHNKATKGKSFAGMTDGEAKSVQRGFRNSADLKALQGKVEVLEARLEILESFACKPQPADSLEVWWSNRTCEEQTEEKEVQEQTEEKEEQKSCSKRT